MLFLALLGKTQERDVASRISYAKNKLVLPNLDTNSFLIKKKSYKGIASPIGYILISFLRGMVTNHVP